MSQLNKISLDGVEYVRADQYKAEPKGPTKIVVLQRGWMLVGEMEKEGTTCKLKNAAVIRSWGTTKGLGELAQNGPQPSTKLDKCNGLVEFDVLTVVLSISVNEDKWKNAL